MSNENDIDFTDLILDDGSESWEINPEVAGVEPLEDDLISRYNPFTHKFEKVPPNWRLRQDLKTQEWHFRPG